MIDVPCPFTLSVVCMTTNALPSTRDAGDTTALEGQFRGRYKTLFYNHVRPHSALGGRAPSWLSVPPCSPGSRPLRVACGDGLRPALTQAARDGSGEDGRDGETALDRTEKHRHDGRGGNRGLCF